ncbi:MAG TPA: ABC transporter permease [Herpetosiphonaceae bacterium]|nr:ABC transporter permease [Herpetosiphonaceae bacterium]
MTIRDILKTAWTNLRRRPARTTLTSVGVAVGALTIVAMVSLGIGVQQAIRAQFEEIGLQNLQIQPREVERDEADLVDPTEPRPQPLTDADLARWRSMPGVTGAFGLVHVDSSMVILVRRPGSDVVARPLITGMDFELRDPFDPRPTALAGDLLPPKDGMLVISLEAAQAISLTGAPAELLGQPVQLLLETPRGDSQTFDFTIAGVSSHLNPAVALTAQDTAALKEWWFNTPDLFARRGYDEALVTTSGIEEARQMIEPLRAEGFEVQSVEILYSLTNRIFTMVQMMLGSVGGLALMVAALGVMNTLAMAIYERTREIGILKAVGASTRDIRRLFLIEAALIGMLGGAAGSLLGWLITLGLNQLIIANLEATELPPTGKIFVVTWWLVAGVIGFAMFISSAAGLLPAMRAARLEPVSALREGG